MEALTKQTRPVQRVVAVDTGSTDRSGSMLAQAFGRAAGFGMDRAGRRITGIEPREVDQGQHDGDRDVLAVSSAGMLARRDVWDQVGGFDPGMRLFREDTDFCWRVQAAGYRVRVVTDAVIYHV